jgi:hypothetical protein
MHLAMRRQRNIAKVAMARRLGVRLYWMWRNGWEYVQLVKFGSNAGQLGTWRAVERRPHEWASRSLARGSLNY